MKPGAIYRRAARELGEESGCCWAIGRVLLHLGRFESYEPVQEFELYFKPVQEFELYFKPVQGGDRYWYGDFTSENQLARQLALLFMAEMAEEE